MIEPIQGEGGVYPCSTDYVREVRALCDKYQLLLIFDEVQCGLGRSGHLFASDEFGVEPDIITLAKSLAGGVPIGALLAKQAPADTLIAGSHAATFGGNPLACTVGVASLNVLLEEQLPQRAERMGAAFMQNLKSLQGKHESIKEIRGRGLMIGLQMNFPVAEIIKKLRERGYLAGPAGPNVLRFLPPLIIAEDILNDVVNVLDEILDEMK